MKYNKLYALAMMAAVTIGATACSDEEPVITDRNLPGTTNYYDFADEQKADIYYKPYVGYVGDPMPFYDPVDNNFKVMYLQDFRPNQAYTYHPIWCVETDDCASYTSLGELVPCGSEKELDAALGTGSTIYNDGVYYTFYTAHSPSQSITAGINEAVMLATSTDFITWTKDRSVLISGGDEYSNVDFRDPFVFRGEDNLFHMLVSTKRDGKGVLAEYTSTDLRQWTSAGVFMTMMWDRFYECADLFQMGEWWYLVYSEQHDAIRRVQYFKGRTIDELKACTANDAGIWPDAHEGFLNGRGFYAGKTASNGVDRYIWGWCATKAGNSTTGNLDWGGALVAHKLCQNADGTLYTTEVPAIANYFGAGSAIADVTLSGDDFHLFPRLMTRNRIAFTVTASSANDRFGISLARGSDSEVYYTLMVNPESETIRKINLEEEGGDGFIGNNDSYVFPTPADNVYNVVIVTDNSVVSLYINDVLTYTNRIYNVAKNCWSINSYGADITVSNINVSSK
ncbi:MAG: glycoside hydrolase domain-containing protein [Muribaculaceae bacterium]